MITINFKNHELNVNPYDYIGSGFEKLFTYNDLVDKYYYDENKGKIKKPAFEASLETIKYRLDLLGYTLKNIEQEFNEIETWFRDEYSNYTPISFKQYSILVNELNLEEYAKTHKDEFNELDKILLIIAKEKFPDTDWLSYGETSQYFLSNIIPEITLRLLAENTNHKNISVILRNEDNDNNILNGKSNCLESADKFLIVAEGSTDIYILKKCLKMFYPNILDFFDFIDMEKNYPFTGSGNLYRFLQGLSKINPLNKILAIFDNDAEGYDKYKLCSKLIMPNNIKVVKLPKLEIFNNFATIGPTGEKYMDINSSAVSIECFLDLNYKNSKKPIIRWRNFNDNISKYHGALINKEQYIRKFRDVKKSSNNYDFEKLSYLTNYIINCCIEINDID